MQEVVLSILIDVMNGTPFKSLLPYNTAACRAGLYRVLEKLILCPSAQWPSPLNYATAIFNSGLNDPNLEVKKTEFLLVFIDELSNLLNIGLDAVCGGVSVHPVRSEAEGSDIEFSTGSQANALRSTGGVIVGEFDEQNSHGGQWEQYG